MWRLLPRKLRLNKVINYFVLRPLTQSLRSVALKILSCQLIECTRMLKKKRNQLGVILCETNPKTLKPLTANKKMSLILAKNFSTQSL